MMQPPSDSFRYSRSQKFRLSLRGHEALVAWEAALALARQGAGGRAAHDAGCAGWGGPFGLAADDGRYLAEFGLAGCTLKAATDALRDYGPSPKDVKAATSRLLDAGILELVPKDA
jgi:hypothetical protein